MVALLRPGLLALVLLAPGCFLEMWGGANPWVTSTEHLPPAPEVSRTRACWSVGAAVGFWLDAYGLGVGLSPSAINGQLTYDVDDAEGRINNRALHTRLDVDLPTRVGSPWIYPRGTVVLDLNRSAVLGTAGLSGHEAPADGFGMFAGLTLTSFNRGLALSVGPSYLEYQSEVAMTSGNSLTTTMRSFGAQGRIMITFVPALDMFAFYEPSVIRPLPPGAEHKDESLDRQKNPAGCAFNPHCF